MAAAAQRHVADAEHGLVQGNQLAALGRWLQGRVRNGRLVGLRLLMAQNVEDAMRQLREHDFGIALQFGNYRG